MLLMERRADNVVSQVLLASYGDNGTSHYLKGRHTLGVFLLPVFVEVHLC